MASLTDYQLPGHIVPYQSDLTLPELPRFSAIPKEQLNCIVSPSGITWLAKSKFKSAYMGSQVHAVDCHGIPWRKKKSLRLVMSGEPVKKKEAPVETGADNKENQLSDITRLQISNYLSTLDNPGGIVIQELSTGPRQYKIKKSLVRNRILAYTNSKKGRAKLYFFTVTFPKGMPDGLGYRCLNTWLTALRRENMIREYLWVAERQPETGTIHFHIAVPHYMDVVKTNGIMRRILRNYAKEKVIPFPPSQFGRNEKGKEKYNGVDIQGTWASGKKYVGPKTPTNFADKKKAKQLTFYLTKYITKNNETFEHLAWHNSRGFSAVFFSVALSREQVTKSGLAYFLVPMHSEKIFTRYSDELGTDGKPELDMCFIPWRRDAPEKFWVAINKVNDFFQDLEDSYKVLSKRKQRQYERQNRSITA